MAGDIIDVLVVHAEQSALFEIREDDAPTAAEVGYGAIEEECLESLFIVTTYRGEDRFGIAVGEFEERQVKRLEDGLADGGVGEGLVRRDFERFENGGTQLNDLGKVVEVAGLQGGVLHVVGEAQDLLVFGRIASVVETVEDGEGSDGGGCAAAFAAELSELGAFVGIGVEDDTAGGIEKKGRRHEPTPEVQTGGGGVGIFPVFVEPELAGETRGFLGVGHHGAALRAAEPRFGEIL